MLIALGIEVNLDKCVTNMEVRTPQNLKEVQRLEGRLSSFSWFISKLAEKIASLKDNEKEPS